MVTLAPVFHHGEVGTPAADWTAWEAAHPAPELTLAEFGRLLVVVAHPDDETLGAGGLLRLAAATGLSVEVLVASNGEASHPDSPTTTGQELARIRRREVTGAIALLAPDARVSLLDLPDGRLIDALEPLIDAIQDRLGPDQLVVSTWTGDGHPDHHAVGRAALAAVAGTPASLWQMPVWAWHWARPGDGTLDGAGWGRVAVDADTRAVKRRAMAHHRSQVGPLSGLPGDEALLSAGFLANFEQDRELFLVCAGPRGGSGLPAAAAASQSGESAGPESIGAQSTGPESTGPESTGAAASLDQRYFDEFYSGREDPWGFGSRWYEERKRALTMAILPHRRFVSAFEPGCSIGVLTAQLAPRCDALLATDIAAAPLAVARERLRGVSHVRFEQLAIPQQWPDGRFDLIVLSEMAYYCSTVDLEELVRRAEGSLTANGVMLLCHWRHSVADYPQTGDEVHRVALAVSGMSRLAGYLDEDVRIDVLVRPPAVSVGAREGLA